jgi:hypothetical protein
MAHSEAHRYKKVLPERDGGQFGQLRDGHSPDYYCHYAGQRQIRGQQEYDDVRLRYFLRQTAIKALMVAIRQHQS